MRISPKIVAACAFISFLLFVVLEGSAQETPDETLAALSGTLVAANKLRDARQWRCADELYTRLIKEMAALGSKADRLKVLAKLNDAYTLQEWSVALKAAGEGDSAELKRQQAIKQYGEAAAAAETAGDSDTAFLARNNRAMLLYDSGRAKQPEIDAARQELESIQSTKPTLPGSSGAESLGHYRFNLGQVLQTIAELKGSTRIRDQAVRSYGQAIELGSDTSVAFCRVVELAISSGKYWQNVKEAVYSAATPLTAREWRQRIFDVLRGTSPCATAPGTQPRGPQVLEISNSGRQTLFRALLETYDEVTPDIIEFTCSDWPTLDAISKRQGDPKFRRQARALASIFAPTTPSTGTSTALSSAITKSRADCTAPPLPPFGQNEAKHLKKATDEPDTVPSLLKKAGDEWELRCSEESKPNIPCDHSESLSRYEAAWRKNPENTLAAVFTAAILHDDHANIKKARVEQLRTSLLKIYDFPTAKLPRLRNRIERLASGNLDSTFDDYTQSDLNNICATYAFLSDPAIAGQTTRPAPSCLGRNNRVGAERSYRESQKSPLTPTPPDGGKVVRGIMPSPESTVGGAPSPAEPIETLRIELRSYWPASLRVAKTAVDPDTNDFSARFKRRFVSGQTFTFRNYGDGSLIRNAPYKATVSPRIVPESPLEDWGSTRVYVQAGSSLVLGKASDVANLDASVTVDRNWYLWGAGRLLAQPTTRNFSPTPENFPGFTYLLNTFAEAEFAPLQYVAGIRSGGTEKVALLQSSRSGTLELGAYLPIFPNEVHRVRHFWKPGVFELHDRPYATFIAPVVKTGLQFLNRAPTDSATFTSGSGERGFVAGGIGIGVLRFVSFQEKVSPALLGRLDILYGTWNRLRIPSSIGPSQQFGRLEIAGTGKIPNTVIYLGFSENLGHGLNDSRLTVGVHLDVGWTVSKMSRPKLAEPMKQPWIAKPD